jgi:hypothetical protein
MPNKVSRKILNSYTPDALETYIAKGIYRAFAPGSHCRFPLPPTQAPGISASDSVNKYGWIHSIYSGIGPMPKFQTGCPNHIVVPDTTEVTYADLFRPQTSDLKITDAIGAEFGTDDQDWSTVPTKQQKRSYASAASTPNTSVVPMQRTPPRPAKRPHTSVENPTNFIMRFSRKVKENENRMAPWQIMNAINELAKTDPKIYSVTCISAKWTEAGNIVLKFDNKTKPDNVRKAGASICQKLCHGRSPQEIKLSENIIWSKVVLRGVPC